ncbi:CaiB/BaiF CoA-transferase family protein [Streptomyces sp. B6B3]|uniref:CaiB/BaiF CoA transferase family protein n=1 Tax=Streptomyces sp. B6B3 TaxID=3153570 RepID=UPI00325D675F
MAYHALPQADRPLDGMLVLDFSQFLAGPVAALRLADLGARVIKIERPGTGDIGRRLAFAGLELDGDTLSFHAMNRGKQSFTADLKSAPGLDRVKELVRQADVLVQNFRPGVMERIGLDYESASALNPRLVYGTITGYGPDGPWRDKPGQDLLAQSVSGLPWLNGNGAQGPVAVGLSLADSLASIHLAHGITALLLRRERTGRGGTIETSLLEGMLDLQFELLTARFFDPDLAVKRGSTHSAHAFLPAPYGIYPTADGHLALAMNPVPRIGSLIGLPALTAYQDPRTWWTEQEKISELLAAHLATRPTDHWLDLLEPADVWCAPVHALPELIDHEGFTALEMTHEVRRAPDPGSPAEDAPPAVRTTRSPLRIDGGLLSGGGAAPRLGEHNEAVRAEFLEG